MRPVRHHRCRKAAIVALAAAAGALTAAGPVLACGGLVTPSGNVKLARTSTLAAWDAGQEHYVTAFTFTGGGAEVGSIVPLPGIPSKVERGGDWTLQRLDREAKRQPRPAPKAAAATPASAESGKAEVVQETRIDALDITVLKGGGQAVADWARENGFSLTPDAPEVLDFYATRSPVFMAARFDATAANEQGQQQGEGTPVHLTVPLEQPWVPLRILGLGRAVEEVIQADVFLLTPDRPTLLPAPSGRFTFNGAESSAPGPGSGLFLGSDEPASAALLADLRSDKGMEWVPERMWFTSIEVIQQAGELKHDLAMDVTPAQAPSRTAAGLEPVPQTTTTAVPTPTTAAAAAPPPAPRPVPVNSRPPRPAPAPAPAVTPPPAPAPDLGGLSPVPGIVPTDEVARRIGAARAALAAQEEKRAEVALPVRPVSAEGGGLPGAWTVAAAIAGGGLGAGAVAALLRRRGLS